MNILVLHRLGDPAHAPAFLVNHTFLLKNNCPGHNYIYHDTNLPIPDYVRDTKFDAIILDVTLLCMRWAPSHYLSNIKNTYDFVRESDAVKIAFPQDEYDCSEILDDWMIEWSVDIVFSVISSNWDILYPKFHKHGTIKLGYTAYVDDSLIDTPAKPFNKRKIDIGYRARKLPPYFGKIGETKWQIGQRVRRLAQEAGMTTDIALGTDSTLVGQAWFEFINNSKFTLGSNSGSSLLDPRGNIQRNVRKYLLEYPEATFEDVEKNCFKGLDGKHLFTAISPRVLEAALLNSCQILVRGEYSEIIHPWDHYIPISEDASDFDSVKDAISDQDLVNRMIKNCRDTILSFDDLRQANHAQNTINIIEELVLSKNVSSHDHQVEKVIKKYKEDMPRKYNTIWRKNVIRRKIYGHINSIPLLSKLAKKSLAILRDR